jgi:1,4-alpha-glucan branching enzyme
VPALTAGESFRTRDTVPMPTPASAATCAMVVPLIPHPASDWSPDGSGSILAPLSSPRCVCCAAMTARTPWREGVLYQIYPRSFADSDGDGIGDLRGILARLDHLEWLGIEGLWLNPTMPSPNDDWGYDVSDYCAVHPDLGTIEDLDALVAAARERGIGVLLDLVPTTRATATRGSSTP